MSKGRDRIAFVIDGRVHGAPVVQSVLSGQFQFIPSGGLTSYGFVSAISQIARPPRYRLLEEGEES